MYKAWEFYRARLVGEAARTGLPVARHLFLHYPADERVQALTYQQFLVGTDRGHRLLPGRRRCVEARVERRRVRSRGAGRVRGPGGGPGRVPGRIRQGWVARRGKICKQLERSQAVVIWVNCRVVVDC